MWYNILMQLIKNKKLQIQDNLSPKIGYSDMRMHGSIMLAMIFTLALAPLLGMLASVCVVMIFGLFAAFKIAHFQHHNIQSNLKFQLEMDRIYHYSKYAEWLKKRIELCEERTKPVTSECTTVGYLSTPLITSTTFPST